jgi:RNA-binding motif X-linked protein 2
MNPLTQIKNTQKATLSEVRQGLSDSASWHAKFANSAYVFAGGLSFDLTEGDVLAVFSQYGEIVDVNLVRHEETGKSRGFAFVCYEDQRSTVLAVDNLNGGTVLGRTIRVEHVDDYRLKDEEAAKRKDWRCGCGVENFKSRDNCHKCGGPRPALEELASGSGAGTTGVVNVPPPPSHGTRRPEAWEGPAFAAGAVDEDDAMMRELKARKEAAITRARAAAEGLPLPGEDPLNEAKKEAKRAKKEKKRVKKEAKRVKKEQKKRKRDGDTDEEGLGDSSDDSDEEGMIK